MKVKEFIFYGGHFFDVIINHIFKKIGEGFLLLFFEA